MENHQKDSPDKSLSISKPLDGLIAELLLALGTRDGDGDFLGARFEENLRAQRPRHARPTRRRRVPAPRRQRRQRVRVLRLVLETDGAFAYLLLLMLLLFSIAVIVVFGVVVVVVVVVVGCFGCFHGGGGGPRGGGLGPGCSGCRRCRFEFFLTFSSPRVLLTFRIYFSCYRSLVSLSSIVIVLYRLP